MQVHVVLMLVNCVSVREIRFRSIGNDPLVSFNSANGLLSLLLIVQLDFLSQT